MAVLVTGDQVIEDIRQRLALPVFTTSTFPTLTGIQSMVTDSAVSLSGLLLAINDGHITSVGTITTAPLAGSQVALWSLPYKCLSIKHIHWLTPEGTIKEVRRAGSHEWEDPTSTQPEAWDSNTDIRYRFLGDSVYIWPTPSQSYSLTLYYGRPLTFEYANAFGFTDLYPFWKDWIVNDVCHKVRLAEEKYQAASQYLQQRELCEQHIRRQAPRDEWGVTQVRDVYASPKRYPWR